MATAITPRKLDVDFNGVPKHWMGNDVLATAIANGVNMLFPVGERFFVRSVKQYMDVVGDAPELRAQIKGFFGQEGRHAHAHDEFNDIMRAQGYDIDGFLAFFARATERIEALAPPKLRLATTAACEHYTAIMAEGAFREGMLQYADPRMQQLLAWHAAEEIEHKAVAFDVLQRVDPSYALRIAGLAMATTLLTTFWALGTINLLRQEPRPWRKPGSQIRRGDRDSIASRVFVRGIREYLRRDFHPNQNDQSQLAHNWMISHGIQMPAAA